MFKKLSDLITRNNTCPLCRPSSHSLLPCHREQNLNSNYKVLPSKMWIPSFTISRLASRKCRQYSYYFYQYLENSAVSQFIKSTSVSNIKTDQETFLRQL